MFLCDACLSRQRATPKTPAILTLFAPTFPPHPARVVGLSPGHDTHPPTPSTPPTTIATTAATSLPSGRGLLPPPQMTDQDAEPAPAAYAAPPPPLPPARIAGNLSVEDFTAVWRAQQAGFGGHGSAGAFSRTDSEIAFQDWIKRIPSASNLASAAGGGGGGGGGGGVHVGDDAAAAPAPAGGSRGLAPPPSAGGLKVGGIPRVPSLDLLRQLVAVSGGPGSPPPPPGALPPLGKPPAGDDAPPPARPGAAPRPRPRVRPPPRPVVRRWGRLRRALGGRRRQRARRAAPQHR